MAVVITGYEIQSPLGCTREESFASLQAGLPRVENIQSFDAEGFPFKAAGEVRENGQVIATPSNIDRKVYFLERTLSQLIENTALDTRYTEIGRAHV